MDEVEHVINSLVIFTFNIFGGHFLLCHGRHSMIYWRFRNKSDFLWTNYHLVSNLWKTPAAWSTAQSRGKCVIYLLLSSQSLPNLRCLINVLLHRKLFIQKYGTVTGQVRNPRKKFTREESVVLHVSLDTTYPYCFYIVQLYFHCAMQSQWLNW